VPYYFTITKVGMSTIIVPFSNIGLSCLVSAASHKKEDMPYFGMPREDFSPEIFKILRFAQNDKPTVVSLRMTSRRLLRSE